VTLADLKSALWRTTLDVMQNHTLLMAAALSYYFVLSLFPALVFLSAALAYLPLPNIFNQSSNIFVHILPADAIAVVKRVAEEVVIPHKRTLLSFGVLGTLWSMSSGFSAAIEALNVAYDVTDDRPFWVTRWIALRLTLVSGLLLLVAFAIMILGPRFGEWLAMQIHLSRLFVILWPYIHWITAISLTVLAVEALYYLGPNVQQRFVSTLPGAVLAVGCWIGLSYLLGIYFRHFAKFDKTYGTLGAAVALLIWLYWTGFAILAGAELNAELAKRSRLGRLESKPPAGNDEMDSAA
jgi:membrane protein